MSAARTTDAEARRLRAELAIDAVAASTQLSSVLGGGGDAAVALERVAEALVPVLGDWVVVTLADPDGGRMRDVATWHREPALREEVARYARLRLRSVQADAPIWRTLGTGEPMVVDDVPAVVGAVLPEGEVRESFSRLDPRSAVALPMSARGRTLGALSIYRSPDRPGFDGQDVTTVREIASRVALAVDNARLHAQQRRLAEGLQRSLLTDPPVTDSAEIVVRYDRAVEAAEVGGTGTTPSSSPTAPRCWSSATSSATTRRPRQRWGSCAACSVASPTATASARRTCCGSWTGRCAAWGSRPWPPLPSSGWRTASPAARCGCGWRTPGTRRRSWSTTTGTWSS